MRFFALAITFLSVFWLTDSITELNDSEFSHGNNGLVCQADGFVFINRTGLERISVWAV